LFDGGACHRLHETVQEITSLMATTKPAAASGGGQQLQAYQKDMLEKLRALRECLETERAPFAKMQVERDQAVAEKEKVCCVCIRSMHPVVVCSYGVFSQNALIVDASPHEQLAESNEKMAYRIKVSSAVNATKSINVPVRHLPARACRLLATQVNWPA
jgi:hypothetical protein